MTKEVILTGLRANNDLHLGNYLGALLPLVDMANSHSGKYQINLFVPDLHSFTTPIDHTQLQGQIMNNLRVFIAAGLDISSSDIFLYRQSYIPAHSELTIILNNFVQFGVLSRMTQFKDKSNRKSAEKHIRDILEPLANAKEPKLLEPKQAHSIINFMLKMNEFQNTSVGLFDYPVLMASDILLYGASYVPVGDDQTQHLEFTRDIAERMNNQFGNIFVVPKPVTEQHKFFGKDQGLRIRDLVDPTRKMSKSDETGKGVIFLSDTPESATKKIMSATTDSFGDVQYNYQTRPGISNLLDIYVLFGGNKDEFIGHDQYGPLKQVVATKVSEFLVGFQSKLSKVSDRALESKLTESEQAMSEVANLVLSKLHAKTGLR